MGVAASTEHSAEGAVLSDLAGQLLDVLDELAGAMARHIHEELPELGALDDPEAVEATRTSCHANLREIFCMVRGGVSAEAFIAPFAALDYARFMRHRGVGLASVLAAYKHGVGMFRAVVKDELASRIPEAELREAAVAPADAFVLAYVDGVTARLADEFGADREDWRPHPADDEFRLPVSTEAARRLREDLRVAGRWLGQVTGGRLATAEDALAEMSAQVCDVALDEKIGDRLSRAGTTVRIELLDEPELSRVLLLNRSPVTVVDDPHEPAEIVMRPLSVDLDRLWAEGFHLPMAIVKGRVGVEGPVRKFLRVAPILRRRRRQPVATAAPA